MIISIDPSFTRTGIFISDGGVADIAARRIEMKGTFYSIEIEDHKGEHAYPYIVIKSELIVDKIESLVKVRILDFNRKVDTIILEYPPPNSSYSAGLYFLNSEILKRLVPLTNAKVVYLCPPASINNFIGKQSVKKSYLSVKLAEMGYVTNRKINHDEASAFLLYELVQKKLAGEKTPTVYKVSYHKNKILELKKV